MSVRVRAGTLARAAGRTRGCAPARVRTARAGLETL